MALKKPLVLTNGAPEQLQSSDSLDLGSAGKHRIVVSGSITVAASSLVTLTTGSRNTSELLRIQAFVTNNVAGAGWSEDLSTSASSDNVILFFQRTANTNEFMLVAKNNGTSSRTIEWLVYGITP
jgi:hypothetical protein